MIIEKILKIFERKCVVCGEYNVSKIKIGDGWDSITVYGYHETCIHKVACMPENYTSEQVKNSLIIFEEIEAENKRRKERKEEYCEKIKKYCWGRK